jgi:hypothetical protein
MKRLGMHAAAVMVGVMGLNAALAGEASTSASAAGGLGAPGTANATAGYDGTGGQGFARTRSENNEALSFSRGLAVGFDRDGLDVSFSHALAPVLGPAYAGTFNLSIGTNGQVSSSYGGTLAQGGLVRSVQAGGTTRSDPRGATAQAVAAGQTAPGGKVDSWTRSNSSPSLHGARPMPVGASVRPGVRPISIVRSSLR